MSVKQSNEYRRRMRAQGYVIFTYRVRIAIPEITSKGLESPYKTYLSYISRQLYKQLGSKSKDLRMYFTEGYDDIRGKYLEHKIERFVRDNKDFDEKIIWITLNGDH